MTGRALLLGLSVAAFSGGCLNSPPTIGDPAPTLDDGEAERKYKEILNRFTGTGEVYRGLDTHLFAGATYEAWPFREARVRRMARFKRMSEEEIAARLREERADWEKFHVFAFGAWAQDPRFDDFDQKNSVWRIALSTDGIELLPAEVRRMGRVDQNIRAIYPYMGNFWVRYRIAFPKAGADGKPLLREGTKTLTLRLASTLGTTDLRMAAE